MDFINKVNTGSFYAAACIFKQIPLKKEKTQFSQIGQMK
jgi:hypothetical protein